MSKAIVTAKAVEPSLTSTVFALARHYLGGRRGLILITVAALGAGMVLNWGWFVALGIAPLLLALAPCAVMCALGLCMNKTGEKSGSTEDGREIRLDRRRARNQARPDRARAMRRQHRCFVHHPLPPELARKRRCARSSSQAGVTER